MDEEEKCLILALGQVLGRIEAKLDMALVGKGMTPEEVAAATARLNDLAARAEKTAAPETSSST